MAHPLAALRILLGILALFFGYFLGRVATRLHAAHQPLAKAVTWVLRTVVCLLGVLWGRGLDAISVVALVLVAAAIAAGVWVELRPRPTEEIHIFKE
jgi:hypothetical protein